MVMIPLGAFLFFKGQDFGLFKLGMFAQPISFIGLPVLTVPITAPGALPLGVQLIAAPWREDRLFAAAARLERLGVCGALAPESIAP